MSAVGGSAEHRITLGYLAQRYGFDLEPAFASNVTITSLANDVASIRPGSLFIAPNNVNSGLLERSGMRGAYAVLLPPAERVPSSEPQIPILFGQPSTAQLGALTADIAGLPSQALAMFAVCSFDDDESGAVANMLHDFLHILGNPVALISAQDSSSLDSELHASYPLNIIDVQRFLSLATEDGAAAAVISLDSDTLEHDAMSGVDIDVLGVAWSESHGAQTSEETNAATADAQPAIGRERRDNAKTQPTTDEMHACAEQAARSFGFVLDSQTHVVGRTSESDALATHSSLEPNDELVHRLSLAISMAMAAGVRRNTIRNALHFSREIR